MSTIKRVAAHAGVSATTVSHVLNRTRPVSEETRLAVEKAVRQLRYVPSAVARSLRQQATNTVGLLISDNANPFFAELSRGIEDVCYRHGYSVFLCNSYEDADRQERHLRMLLERRVDGVLVGSTGDLDAVARQLADADVPVVVVDRPVPGAQADTVRIDHALGSYLATRHLLELGHRAIGCITGPASAPSVSPPRLAGYRRALVEWGLEAPARWVTEGDFTARGGYLAAGRLLLQARLTALFVSNDPMAIGAMRRVAEWGLSIPRDFSVVGFDGIALGAYVEPGLTTVNQSTRHLGEVAAARLIERIRGERSGRFLDVVIEPKLVVRGSTAPPLGG